MSTKHNQVYVQLLMTVLSDYRYSEDGSGRVIATVVGYQM